LLAPRPWSVRTNATWADLNEALTATDAPHIDLETTGLEAHDPSRAVVGVGVASSRGVWYLDVRRWGPDLWAELLGRLAARGLYAFNAAFDLAWLWREADRLGVARPPLRGCSLTLFRLLATEGYPGQSWSLDVAVRTVLRWSTSQKSTLNDLLVRHGLVRANGTADKGRMWELAALEPDAFGMYCAWDAEASRQLWLHLAAQTFERWPALRMYATEEWPTMIELLVEQQLRGMTVDRARLAAHLTQLEADTAAAQAALVAHPRLAPHIAAKNAELLAEHTRPNVTTKRVRAKRADAPWLDTSGHWVFQASEAGSLARWERERGGYWYHPVRTEHPRNVGVPAPQFNWESDPHLRWLLYECVYRAEVNKELGTATVDLGGGDSVVVKLTDGGQPPVGKEVLPALGEIGALMTRLNKLLKETSYVRAYLAATERDGLLHPQLKPHGAISGRLSGGSER
jgi:hypothetical protein